MIKLTRSISGDPIWINPYHITCIVEEKGQMQIWTVGDGPEDYIPVVEEPEYILQLIKETKS